jgi:hypothetical protein
MAATVACGDDSGRASGEEKDALKEVYGDPIFDLDPPGVGRRLRESFPTDCDAGGREPSGGRAYQLTSDGEELVTYYRRQASPLGWSVQLEGRIDPAAPLEDARPSLVLRRPSDGRDVLFTVTMGRRRSGDRSEVVTTGSVEGASFCR